MERYLDCMVVDEGEESSETINFCQCLLNSVGSSVILVKDNSFKIVIAGKSISLVNL